MSCQAMLCYVCKSYMHIIVQLPLFHLTVALALALISNLLLLAMCSPPTSVFSQFISNLIDCDETLL